MRLADLGVHIGSLPPGPANAITDVEGCRVGHATLISGDGDLVVGKGPVRTGVTVVLPHSDDVWSEPVFGGAHSLNGNGEVTGLLWINEAGLLSGPVAITNTSSVGLVRDALQPRGIAALPVVGETDDSTLNDIGGFHVRPEHVHAALRTTSDGRVAEGNVGGGTGMICHGFKAGIGTASRQIKLADSAVVTVGVLVQANYGRRSRLTIDGVPVGRYIPERDIPDPRFPSAEGDRGSIIAVVGTDAPLLPHQCRRLAQRAGLGVARVGGVAANSSGDVFVAFATGNRGLSNDESVVQAPVEVRMLPDAGMTYLFEACVDATEEAIVNSLLAAETMTGRDGNTAFALPPERLEAILAAHTPTTAEVAAFRLGA